MTEALTARDDHNWLEAVRRFIGDHLDEPLPRKRLALLAGFSVPHFQRLFAASLGESGARYVRRQRLERAARKLRLGAVDITEVAQAAGYDTHAAFGKAFKRQYGLSPSAFRRLGCMAANQLILKARDPHAHPTHQRPGR